MGFLIKIIAFIIFGYIVFYKINTKNLRVYVINGTLKSKFLEKDSEIKTHFTSSLSYFKNREKYFVIIETENNLMTEQIDKAMYSSLKIEKPIKLVKYYTRLTNKLFRVCVNQ